jgi:alpha-L-fucosidase 2
MASDLRLWYRSPARTWPNALPIGNGKFGAMVWGQVQKERWQLNEDSVWYGGPQDRNPKDALKYLPDLRQLLDKGQLADAERLVERAFVAMPESQRHYETLGLANFIFPHREAKASNYKRWLDLKTATTGVSYDFGGVTFMRELFASQTANVIAAEFTASKPGMVTFDLRIIRQAGMPILDRSPDAREMDPEGVDTNIYMDSVTAVNNVLVMKARTGGDGVQLCLTATVTAEGGMPDRFKKRFYSSKIC